MIDHLHPPGGDHDDATDVRIVDSARPPFRLRDLRGRERGLAFGMSALLLLPFVVALVRAFHDGWIPSGDEANIATRALDVFSRHPPLTGLPSTSLSYGTRIPTNHPGPIEFYLLAVPVRVLGGTIGPLVTAAAINCAFVLISCWVFLRRLGSTVMLWAGVLLLAVMFSAGTSVLTDTLSSNMTMYSLLCTTVLAWALVDGDIRLLPLAAFVGGYAAQEHLEAGLIVLPLVIVAIVALGAHVVVGVRRGEVGLKRVARRASLQAAAIAAVCWAPVAIDQISGHPGNLTHVIRFARDNTRPTVGLKAGVYQALHSISPPGAIGRSNTTGLFFLSSPGIVPALLAVLVVGALIVTAVNARAGDPTLARLAGVGLIVLAAGVVNGTNVPSSLERVRVNLYRWTWSAAFVTWAALGIGIAILVGRAVARRPAATRLQRLGPPALFVVATLLAATIMFVQGGDDHNRERNDFAVEKRINAAVLAHIDPHRPVLVVQQGRDANLSVGPALVFRLRKAGVQVELSSFYSPIYGSAATFRPSSQPAVVFISSGKAQLPSGPGELLVHAPFRSEPAAEFNRLAAQRTALINELSAAALGSNVVLAPDATEWMKGDYSAAQRYTVSVEISRLSTDPRTAIQDPEFLELVLAGRLLSPALDKSKVRMVLRPPKTRFRGTYGDQQVEARYFDSVALASQSISGCCT